MSYREITDAQIAAYAPNSFRLLSKYRDNKKAAPRTVFAGMITDTSFQRTTDTSGGYVSVGNIRVGVSDAQRPRRTAGRTVLELWCELRAELTGGTVPIVSVYARLAAGAYISNEVGPVIRDAPGQTQTKMPVLRLEYVPVAGFSQVIDVQLRLDVQGTGVTGEAGTFFLLPDECRNYSALEE